MTCFLQLGWRFPKHVYDLHTAYLSVSNILLPYNPDEKRIKQRKGLSDACRAYGIEGWETDRQTGNGQGDRRGPLARIRSTGSVAILRGGRSQFGRAVAASARRLRALSRRSIPSSSCAGANTAPRPSPEFRPGACRSTWPLWNLVQENKSAVIGALIARFDPSQGSEYPIYSPEGEFSSWRFEQWLIAAGITEWPRLDSGALQLDGDAFRMMYGAHPAIEGLHALRDSLGVIVRARIPIGPDGRNRPSLFPFGTATGRNAQAKSLFNAHASMRSFMKFPDAQDRALSRLANAGSRYCRGAQR